MRALEVREARPVAIEQPDKDHCLYFGGGLLLVAVLVAGVVGAVGIDRGSKQDVFSIGRPHRTISLTGNIGKLVRIAGKLPPIGIKSGRPDLRTAITAADKDDLLAIRRPAAAIFTGSVGGELSGIASGPWDNPEVRRLFVFLQV